ncbi:hypothetical protein D915_006136 [Fasciola hepatica]|uniref:Uncharacterized protein n=1 Tax=Fasciola hepatica TaxID=6192 RepID=A0A4E0R8M5_FASHE|nr:hypothetical protein D915_006136 [Fasciola hepatica]
MKFTIPLLLLLELLPCWANEVESKPIGHPGLPWYVHKRHLIHRLHHAGQGVSHVDGDENGHSEQPQTQFYESRDVDPELKEPSADFSDVVDSVF